MSRLIANGIALRWNSSGSGEGTVILIHGSWANSKTWGRIVPLLARSSRVITYDRRGHGNGEMAAGTVIDDVRDLEGLVQVIADGPVGLIGHSMGGVIALRLAMENPGICRWVSIHEPPLFGLLAADSSLSREIRAHISTAIDRISAGDLAAGASAFFDRFALGRGGWDALPESARVQILQYANTWVEEARDPSSITLDNDRLGSLIVPTQLTTGALSSRYYHRVADAVVSLLPNICRQQFSAAGHTPHVTHPAEFVAVVESFANSR